MSDQNVKAAQKYLNAMFGGHKDWVKLDEDGKTGTAVMQGIIRASYFFNLEESSSTSLFKVCTDKTIVDIILSIRFTNDLHISIVTFCG